MRKRGGREKKILVEQTLKKYLVKRLVFASQYAINEFSLTAIKARENRPPDFLEIAFKKEGETSSSSSSSSFLPLSAHFQLGETLPFSANSVDLTGNLHRQEEEEEEERSRRGRRGGREEKRKKRRRGRRGGGRVGPCKLVSSFQWEGERGAATLSFSLFTSALAKNGACLIAGGRKRRKKGKKEGIGKKNLRFSPL